MAFRRKTRAKIVQSAIETKLGQFASVGARELAAHLILNY